MLPSLKDLTRQKLRQARQERWERSARITLNRIILENWDGIEELVQLHGEGWWSFWRQELGQNIFVKNGKPEWGYIDLLVNLVRKEYARRKGNTGSQTSA